MSTSDPEGTDNTRLARLLDDCPLQGPEELTLIGGALAGEGPELGTLLGWLAGLGSGPWFRCLEWTDRLRLVRGDPEPPPDPGLLVWGRWFGPDGDLELWRAGEGFSWRFIGPGRTARPDHEEVPHASYFEDDIADGTTTRVDEEKSSARCLRRGPERIVQLWQRNDDRVATAEPETLAALPAPEDERARLRYMPYLDRGVIAAVWYRTIEGLREDWTGAE